MAIEIIDTLSQKNSGDFPLVDSNDIRGGFYQVNSIEERDLIPSIRRKEGMLCYVKNGELYQLVNGVENTNWVVFSVGSDFDGDYESLINKPHIPKKTSELENDSGYLTDSEVDISKIHTHDNFNALSKITEDKVTQWDSKSDSSHNHDDVYTKKSDVYSIEEVDNIIEQIDSAIDEIKNKECESPDIFVGEESPVDDKFEVWIDTSDDEEYTGDLSDLILNEVRAVFSQLNGVISELKKKNIDLEARIYYLETNYGGNGGSEDDDSGDSGSGGNGSVLGTALTFEDGTILTFEDGVIMTFE